MRQTHYDLLRLILVICVVVGHGTFYTVSTMFGGIYYGRLMAENGIAQPIIYSYLDIITKFIYTFHMPAFVALSGSLYAFAQPRKFHEFFLKKFKRLIVPFIVVWIFWNIPIKFISSYYNGVSIPGIFLQMLMPSNVYLWYLESLFFVFMIMYFLTKLNSNKQCIIVGFIWAVGLILYRWGYKYSFLGNPLYWCGWFYVGYKIEDIINTFKRYHIWNGFKIIIWFIAYCVLFMLNLNYQNKFLDAFLNYLFFPFSMIIILNFVVRKYSSDSSIIRKLSDYGMGIYLYAEPLNYLILFWAFKNLDLHFFGTNIGCIVIYFLRIVITPIVAIIVVSALKKAHIKYLY